MKELKTYEEGLMDMLEWVLSSTVIASPTTQRRMRQYLLMGGKFKHDIHLKGMDKYIKDCRQNEQGN